jgi:hypothetical protein
MKEIEDAIKNVESRLGVATGFFDLLENEDDWSFVIKSHALIETSCSELLTIYFRKPSLENIFSRLELGEKYTGKIAFLSCLELLNTNERKYIQELSSLRNKLVHSSKNLNFKFSEHVEGMDANQKNTFVNAFSVGAEITPQLKSQILKNPKHTIWQNLKYLIAIISLQIDTHNFKNEIFMSQEEINKVKSKF